MFSIFWFWVKGRRIFLFLICFVHVFFFCFSDHISAFNHTTKIPRNDPQGRMKIVTLDEKRTKFWAPHPLGPTPPFGAPTPSGPPPPSAGQPSLFLGCCLCCSALGSAACCCFLLLVFLLLLFVLLCAVFLAVRVTFAAAFAVSCCLWCYFCSGKCSKSRTNAMFFNFLGPDNFSKMQRNVFRCQRSTVDPLSMADNVRAE